MHAVAESDQIIWKSPMVAWIFVFVVAALLGLTFYTGIKEMVYAWNNREEYSYGYLIPFITAFLVWQKKNILTTSEFSGSGMCEK